MYKNLTEETKAAHEVADRLEKLVGQAQKPVYPGTVPSGPPSYSKSLGEKPYSMFKAAGLAMGWLRPDQAPEEAQIHERLVKSMSAQGFQPSKANSLLVPIGSRFIPAYSSADESLVEEIRQKSMASVAGADPSEATWVRRKALGTIGESSGGVLIGFPTLGEVIDMQRNLEVFTQAGAREVPLGANGRMMYPKLMSGATAYWVGEAQSIAQSQQTLGQLDLIAKKLGVLVQLNLELIKFGGPSVEAMVRTDMAKVAALKADLAMLEGTGGTQIKGLTTYDKVTAWTSGTDKLINYTGAGAATNGNKFLPEDIYKMESLLPDEVEANAWIGRRDFWGAVLNRRADAVSANDEKGQFLFSQFRDAAMAKPSMLNGSPLVRSSQVSATRVKGTGTDLTYTINGNFQEWLVGRFGVAEFAVSDQGDTVFANYQTMLRMIQFIDAGARHPASFVLYDQLLRS